MKNIGLAFLLSILSVGSVLYGQTGTLEGRIYQQTDGVKEGMYIPIFQIKNDELVPIGRTDFEGYYSVQFPAGEITLVLKNTSLAMRTDTVVVTIQAGIVTPFDYEMFPDGTLSVVHINGDRVINGGGSEIKAIAETKEDDKVGNTITNTMAENKGASNTSDIAKKMTGLSTVGSTLYVRGLGDRYNVAYLNGLPIPSPNPDFRVIPLDVFPTDIVNSVNVSKVMSAELYGDFSGGAFNVTTKSFYSKPTLKISLGTGLNTQTTFQDFRSYQGGKYDYFGFDDGTRQIPAYVVDNSKPSSYPAVNDLFTNGTYNSVEGRTTGFNDDFGTKLNKVMPNTNFAITGGNFFDFSESDNRSKGFGYLALLSHSTSYNYSNGSIKIINAQSEERLNYDFQKYTQETATTGLLNLYVRINPKNNISFNTLYVNNSSDETRETWGKHFDYTRDVYSRRLTYLQNYMSVNQIIGTHQLLPYSEDTTFSRLVLDWRGSYSLTGSQEPNRRQFVSFYDAADKDDTEHYALNFIDRNENHIFYSKLKENELAGKVNLSYTLKYGDTFDDNRDTVLGEVIRLRVGADYKSKTRVFDYKQYNYVLNTLASTLGDNVNIYDIDALLNSDVHDQGQFNIQEVANFGSSYLARLDVTSFYSDLKMVLNRWTLIPGLRYESGTQSVENRNQQSPSIYEKNILLSNVLLPSLITRFDA